MAAVAAVARARNSTVSHGALSLGGEDFEFGKEGDEGDEEKESFSFRFTKRAQDEKWSRVRLAAARFINSKHLEITVNALIVFNLAVVVGETDATVDSESPTPVWVVAANYVLMTSFSCEIVVRLFVYRKSFFYSKWFIMDLTLVCLDWVAELLSVLLSALPSVSVLRIFRLIKLTRGVKFLRKVPQLALLLRGMVASFTVTVWGVLLLSIIVLLWSILAVMFIHPLNIKVADTGVYGDCDRCADAFASVGQSFVTFSQQILAGDSWGTVSVPIIEAYPQSVLILGGVWMTVQILAMNVILAVIVDSALKASVENEDMLLTEKRRKQEEAERHLLRLCSEIDIDGDGEITQEEMEIGMSSNQTLQDILYTMELEHDDVKAVFGIMDRHMEGAVQYKLFVQELHKMKLSEAYKIRVFNHFNVNEVRDKLGKQLEDLKCELLETKIKQQAPSCNLAPLGTQDLTRVAQSEHGLPHLELEGLAEVLREDIRRLIASMQNGNSNRQGGTKDANEISL